MIIDTSAVMAILLGDPESERIARVIAAEVRPLMSAFSALETAMVVDARKGPEGGREWELLVYKSNIELIPFTAAQTVLALEAWRRFGKGKHRAALNIGDCCTYALAAHTGEPVLFKGEDFALTDISCVSW